jgi:hypothetical protein
VPLAVTAYVASSGRIVFLPFVLVLPLAVFSFGRRKDR